MNAQEKTGKKYNVVISKLFQMIIELNEEQQQELLDHAEQLIVREKRRISGNHAMFRLTISR